MCRSEVVQLAVILSRYTELGFYMCAETAIAIGKIGKRLDRLNERVCNEPLDETLVERAYARANQRICALLQECEVLDVTWHINRDPRGFAVRMRFPGKENNNPGGDFGV